MTNDSAIRRAQQLCRGAEALLITSGAGMGVDSGLPDFRGNAGFWRAYPPYKKLGFNFIEMANPARFHDEPELGWGFYGHRLNLYRSTQPHAGFETLRQFGNSLPGGYFSFTSNVDGHFQRAGFDPHRALECHGSIHHMQCVADCQNRIWEAPEAPIEIDESTMRANSEKLPRCPDCGGLARPNILMFGDGGWNATRAEEQENRYDSWLRSILESNLVILEFGAGRAVPTVRIHSERIAASLPNATLIRVNPRELEIDGDGLSLEMGALAAIKQIVPG